MNHRHHFAPGTIERHHRTWWGTAAQRELLMRWLERAFVLCLVVGLGSLAIGL